MINILTIFIEYEQYFGHLALGSLESRLWLSFRAREGVSEFGEGDRLVQRAAAAHRIILSQRYSPSTATEDATLSLPEP